MAERAGTLAVQTGQRVVGVVGNMSWMELSDGSRVHVFGSGGGDTLARTLSRTLDVEVPLLAQIPLDTRVREAGDEGIPLVLSDSEVPASRAMRAAAELLPSRARGLVGRMLAVSPRCGANLSRP